MRKQVPPETTKDVLAFATKRPGDRLRSIVDGLGVCYNHGLPELVLTLFLRFLPMDSLNMSVNSECMLIPLGPLKSRLGS